MGLDDYVYLCKIRFGECNVITTCYNLCTKKVANC